MPAELTYPGVYVEEVPSGVRTITGVATSITAFLGRARRGPTDKAMEITSFADFVRRFGGLHVDDPMGYAVRDFYLNGGSRAIIVRLYKPPGATDGKAKLSVDTLLLEAASEGSWGNKLKATVDHAGIDDDVAARYAAHGLTKNDLFNLTIVDGSRSGAPEELRNLSIKDGPRRVDRVLEQESQLIRIQRDGAGAPQLPAPPNRPAAGESAPAMGGQDSAALGQTEYEGDPNKKTGIHALDEADLFNLLCIPPDTREQDTLPAVYQKALATCVDRRAMLIVDAPAAWSKNKEKATKAEAQNVLQQLSLSGDAARNAALYYPRVIEADPLRDGQHDTFVPCGIVAGIMARTDTQRGVWKAPAGIDAGLSGVQALTVKLTDGQNGSLNPLGINCLRTFPVIGRVVWGARTLRGADQLADEYKYVPVRRLALYIEESLYRGTQWVVFEPNDEPLWAQIRLNVGAFMHNLFRQGAFQGSTPREAYLVKCDSETTTQYDIDRGVVNILVGFAPLKPAEFVILKIQQLTRESQA